MNGGMGHGAAPVIWMIGLVLVALAVLVVGRVVDRRPVRSPQPPALATLKLTLPATSQHMNVVFENHAVETLEEVSWPADHLLAVYHAAIYRRNWSAFSQLPMPSQRRGLVDWRLGSAFWTVIPNGRLLTLLVATPPGLSLRVVSLTEGQLLPAPRVLADFNYTLRGYPIPRGAAVALTFNRTVIYDLKIFLPPPAESVEPPHVVGAFPEWDQSPPSAGPFLVRNAHLGTAPVVAAVLPAGLVVELAHSVGLVTWSDRFVPLLQGSGTFPRRWSIVIGRGPWALIQGPAQIGSAHSQPQSQWWWWNIATGSLTRAPFGQSVWARPDRGRHVRDQSGVAPGCLREWAAHPHLADRVSRSADAERSAGRLVARTLWDVQPTDWIPCHRAGTHQWTCVDPHAAVHGCMAPGLGANPHRATGGPPSVARLSRAPPATPG
jgi:hypothetical protein